MREALTTNCQWSKPLTSWWRRKHCRIFVTFPENRNITYRAKRSNAQSLSSLPRNALVPKLHSFFVPLLSRALSNPVVICVSRAFCSMDQENRETVRSLRRKALAWISAVPPQIASSLSFARKSVNDCVSYTMAWAKERLFAVWQPSPVEEGGGVLPYIGYIGYVPLWRIWFSVWSGKGYINQRV